jgi:glycosyltransferase involved in cell wall biosynthesis
MKYVNVLLSTFNGLQYIEEQLDSIANQDYQAITVSIRDDGSEDGTYDFCRKYVQNREGWNVTQGENAGVFQSFMQLLCDADQQAEYFAFCDQDDIWFPDKISRAVSALDKKEDPNIPLIYFTRVIIADENLIKTGESPKPKYITLESALVENVAQGSTIVLNRAARLMLIKKIPGKLLMHDWWCYLLISAAGEVVYDPVPSMIYRKHALNVSYGAFGWYRKMLGRLNRFFSKDEVVIFKQAENLLCSYSGTIPEGSLKKIEKFVSIKQYSLMKRLLLFVNNPFHRQTVFDNFLIKLYFLFVQKAGNKGTSIHLF